MSSHARPLPPVPAPRFLLRALTSPEPYVVTRHERAGSFRTVRYTVTLAGALLCHLALPATLDSEEALELVLGYVAHQRGRVLGAVERVDIPRPRLVRG